MLVSNPLVSGKITLKVNNKVFLVLTTTQKLLLEVKSLGITAGGMIKSDHYAQLYAMTVAEPTVR